MSPIDTGHSSADAKFNCSADQPELCGTVSLLLFNEQCYKCSRGEYRRQKQGIIRSPLDNLMRNI